MLAAVVAVAHVALCAGVPTDGVVEVTDGPDDTAAGSPPPLPTPGTGPAGLPPTPLGPAAGTNPLAHGEGLPPMAGLGQAAAMMKAMPRDERSAFLSSLVESGLTPEEKSQFAREVMQDTLLSMGPQEQGAFIQEMVLFMLEYNMTRHLSDVQKTALIEEFLPRCPEPPEMSRHFSYVMLGVLVAVLCLFLAAFYYNHWWVIQSQTRIQNERMMAEAENFELALMHHIVPSVSTAKHRFRGISPRSKPISLQFEELGLRLPRNDNCILEDITGEFQAGKLAAIMGPSGAGKTTFMNVLCGKATYGEMLGVVKANYEVLDMDEIRPLTGFVPQDDVVHSALTVRENLVYSAKLRNPADVSFARQRAIVDDVISVLQVSHIQQSLVGNVEDRGISGGQRKRVNIGLELTACPTLLFLDEPTSGLDSTSSLQIIHSLKKMTALGMTIIMVIHQPRYSLFTLFDEVLLLGKGGRLVYQGPSQATMPYFQSLGFAMESQDNPADWFMDLISGEVENKQSKNFKVTALPELWQRNKGTVRSHIGRQWNDSDDHAVIVASLERAWAKIDIDGSGTLAGDELALVLQECTGMKPDDDIVEELIHRMAGEDEEEVTKQEFVQFLKSLQDIVAKDREVEASDSFSNYGDDETETGAGAVPGFSRQCAVLILRELIVAFRRGEMVRRALFVAVIVVFALVVSLNATMQVGGMSVANMGFDNLLLLAQFPLALVVEIAVLSIFQDRPIFWRESSHGLSTVAYFISKLLVKWLDVLLYVALYVCIVFVVTRPRLDFDYYLLQSLALALTGSGWACLFSTLLSDQSAVMVGVIFILLVDLILGMNMFLQHIVNSRVATYLVSAVSGTRWSVPMLLIPSKHSAEEEGRCISFNLESKFTMYTEFGFIFGLSPFWSGFTALLLQAFVLHVLALITLEHTNRSKRV